MRDLAFQQLWAGLTGKLGLLAFLVYWLEALLALVGLFALIESVLIWRRVRLGETIWSALTKWGDRKVYKTDQQVAAEPIHQIVDPPEAEVEIVALTAQQAEVEPQPSTQVRRVREYADALPSEPVVVPPPAPPTFNVDASADMVEDMFRVKSGVLRLLWDHRRIEETAGNVSGMQAIDVLIADVEKTDVQKVWVLGDTKLKLESG